MVVIKNSNKRANQTGSALVYILIAIALLAALTASFMRPASQQTTAQGAFNANQELKSQIEFIRSSIQECVLIYDGGDRGDGTASHPGLVGSPNMSWPINPSSTYYNQTVAPAADDSIEFIRCPGNPGNKRDHASIFGGLSNKFLPPPPKLFEAWEYYSGVDGVFFFTRTDKTDAFLQSALLKLDEDFSECESDVIYDSGSDVELTSSAAAADPKCLAGETCFRVRMIIQASAVYNGDVDGDESSCP